MSAGWGKGSTRAWRKIRSAVLARDGYRCQLTIDGICETRADCVHHLDGIRVSGNDPDRLVASCTPCNLAVGDPASGNQDPPIKVRTVW